VAITHKAMSGELDRRLAAAGGSLSTWIVLREALEGDLSQRELAERMGIEGPTLVRHLDRLEAGGLIERRRDTQDRRVIRIMVTPAGRDMVHALLGVAESTEGEIRALFTDKEYDVLTRALERLHEHMTCAAERRKAGAHRGG
jgi:MarR family transcriptional regulator for hemolysin